VSGLASRATREDVLKWSTEYIEQYGVSPTIRQIMRHFGYRSPCGVQSHLKRLEADGYIERVVYENSARSRGFRLAKRKEKVLALEGYNMVKAIADLPSLGAMAGDLLLQQGDQTVGFVRLFA
jgi:SOS-response transcriptional repressor LexA